MEERYKKPFVETEILACLLGVVIGFVICYWISYFSMTEIDPVEEETPTVVNESVVGQANFNLPERLWALSYPFQAEEAESEEEPEKVQLVGEALYDSYIYEICESYPDVDPEIIRAIVWRESRYDPTVSSGKCVGLMQVSVKWHTDRANQLGVTDLYDPYGNLLTGIDLFNDLLLNYANGDEIYAIMMYNMGCSGARSYYTNGVVSGYAKDVLERCSQQEAVIYA